MIGKNHTHTRTTRGDQKGFHGQGEIADVRIAALKEVTTGQARCDTYQETLPRCSQCIIVLSVCYETERTPPDEPHCLLRGVFHTTCVMC